MKKLSSIMLLSCILIATGSCKKKQSGVCYRTYVSGDKKEFNLSSLPRADAQDSCNVLSGYASGFGGSCKLK